MWGKFCQYFCTEDILDLCDVNSLPGMDKWNSEKPHGMFWRMQVPPYNENVSSISTTAMRELEITLLQPQPLGDPTVLEFQSRDLDGFLTVSIVIIISMHIGECFFRSEFARLWDSGRDLTSSFM